MEQLVLTYEVIYNIPPGMSALEAALLYAEDISETEKALSAYSGYDRTKVEVRKVGE